MPEDSDYFARVRLSEWGAPEWPNGVDIARDELSGLTQHRIAKLERGVADLRPALAIVRGSGYRLELSRLANARRQANHPQHR